jgi:hypothetical protein
LNFINDFVARPVLSHARIESLFRRPLFGHDRILFSTSVDGLTFIDTKIPPLSCNRSRGTMTYGATFDSNKKNFYALSSAWIKTEQSWKQFIFCNGRWNACSMFNLNFVKSISICNQVLYTVQQLSNDSGFTVVAYDLEIDRWPTKQLQQKWPKSISLISDIMVFESLGFFFAVGTRVTPNHQNSFHIFRSKEGIVWEHFTEVNIKGLGKFSVISNPNIVVTNEGLYRIYFGFGTFPAIDNHIASALSPNLIDWELETGVRVGRHGVWANHGVGFPSVKVINGNYFMAYTGFWGNNSEGNKIYEMWLDKVKVLRLE